MENSVAVAGAAITPAGVADNAMGGRRRAFVGRRRCSSPKGEGTQLETPRVMIPGVLALVAGSQHVWPSRRGTRNISCPRQVRLTDADQGCTRIWAPVWLEEKNTSE